MSVYRNVTLMSRLFQPSPKLLSGNDHLLSVSHRLMIDNGLIAQSGPGLFILLPMALRSLKKLTTIIEREMDIVGASQIQCPCLGLKTLWDMSNRWELMGKDLLKTTDRFGSEMCLQPTHEEMIASLVDKYGAEMKLKNDFPLLIYQITEKFRDEIHPRFGLLRGREFLMKDLYSFDLDEQKAQESYENVTNSYWKLFANCLSLPVMRVAADSGTIGGAISHEFHVENRAGQDFIYFCHSCGDGVNLEIAKSKGSLCLNCHQEMNKFRTIEIAHTFQLGTKYTDIFRTNAKSNRKPLYMGCYGIGVTRLLAACIDVFSSDTQIQFPFPINPYNLVIVPPKKGSKEERAIGTFLNDVIIGLSSLPTLNGQVVLDDRIWFTVGRRVDHLRKLGFPYILICAKTIDMNAIPIFELVDTRKNQTLLVTHRQLFDFFD